MEALKAGDVVQLKSGSPKMTIKWCEKDKKINEAECTWFVGDKLVEAVFVAEQLELVPKKTELEAV